MIISGKVLAQNNELDSLETALLSAKSEKVQYEILTELYNELRDQDPDKALFIAKKLLDLSNRLDMKRAASYKCLGLAFYKMEVLDSAVYYLQQVGDWVGNRDDSIQFSIALSNLAEIQFYMGETDKTINYILRSAEIDRDLGDYQGAAIGYQNLGAICAMIDQNDLAEKYLFTSESIASEIGDTSLLLGIYANLAYLGLNTMDYAFSKKYSLQTIEIGEKINDYMRLAAAYRNLAEVYVLNGKYKIAIEYDKRSLENAVNAEDADQIKKAYYCLSLSYEKLGNYKDAYENHKLYSEWSDTVIQRNNRQAILDIQEKYDTEKTAKENEILTQQARIKDLEIAKNNEEINKSRIIIWSSIAGLVLLVILAFTLYNRNLIKQKANLQLQEANDIINEKNKDITASIEYASKIQEALLPTKENSQLFKDSFIMLQPKDIVSGDFYWYANIDGKKIISAIDCTGHGVPGAFMSMIGNTFLHEIVNEKGITAPGKILDNLRDKVINALNQKGLEGGRRDGMDMSICTIDEVAMTMEFAGANNPVYIARNGQIVEIKGDKQPVGYLPEKSRNFTNHSVKIESGDAIYLFSDGYADQFGGSKGKKFKYKQLRELLLNNSNKTMSEQKQILVNTFIDWKGNLEQIDDVCVIGVRI